MRCSRNAKVQSLRTSGSMGGQDTDGQGDREPQGCRFLHDLTEMSGSDFVPPWHFAPSKWCPCLCHMSPTAEE